MADDLMIGVELLDYIKELEDVENELIKAWETASEIKKILGGEDTYEGEASETLMTFATGLEQHLERLLMLYQKAASYVSHTYESMYQSDIAMAAWLLDHMEESQVKRE